MTLRPSRNDSPDRGLSQHIVIRQMRKDDLYAVFRIDQKVRSQDDRWTESQWYDAWYDRFTLSAMQDSALAGYIVYEQRRRSLQIQRIGVHPAVWRCGVGSALLERVATIARDDGLKFVEGTITLTTAMLPALNLFKACGWAGHLSEHGDSVYFLREFRS